MDVLLELYLDIAQTGSKGYEQTGFLSRICAINGNDIENFFHVIDQSSHKQHRISHCSYEAEIIAVKASED